MNLGCQPSKPRLVLEFLEQRLGRRHAKRYGGTGTEHEHQAAGIERVHGASRVVQSAIIHTRKGRFGVSPCWLSGTILGSCSSRMPPPCRFPLHQARNISHEPGEERRQVVLPPDQRQRQRQLEVDDFQYRHASGRFRDEADTHALGEERQAGRELWKVAGRHNRST